MLLIIEVSIIEFLRLAKVLRGLRRDVGRCLLSVFYI